jgi:hypothetical protein
MEDTLEDKFDEACARPSDINQHMTTLYRHSMESLHITECGVRNIVSSYAFAFALANRKGNRFVQVDPYKSDQIDTFHALCEANGIDHVFYEASDLDSPMEKTDLLFIDTWHVYAQLKRELERWHSYAGKYIILHDTTVDGEFGESIRCGWDTVAEAAKFGFPREEIERGLWPAVEEFLRDHPEWKLHKRYTHNNGLTVLQRVA